MEANKKQEYECEWIKTMTCYCNDIKEREREKERSHVTDLR